MSNFFIKTTFMIVVVTLLGRLLSFFRNVFLTNKFGVGIETDAYLMAFTLPMMLFLVVPGAVTAILIPTLKGLTGEEHAVRRNELFHKSLTIMILLFFMVSAAGMVWAAEIVSFIAAGFAPEKQALTAELLRLMMPSALFIGIIAVCSSVLNAHYRFFEPTVGTVINGLIVIISLYTLAPILGIHGVAWGTTIGYVLFAGYLIYPTLKQGYSLRMSLRLRKDPELRGMGERFVPIFIGILISQLYLLVERMLASGLGDQKITALSLALGIVQLPIAIFAGALAIPLFPLLAEYVKKQQMGRMKEILRKGLLYQYHILLPAMLGFILLSQEIVDFFYNYSSVVTDDDIALTAWAMIFYSFSMLGRAGRDLLIRASYAIENTRTPVIIGGVSIGLYVIMGFLLIRPLDLAGLALAYSLANLINLLLQSWFLQKQIGPLYDRPFYFSLGKGVLAVIVMTVGVGLLNEPTAGWGKLQVPVLVTVAAVLYGSMLLLLKEKLLKELLDKVTKRLKTGGGKNGV